MTLGAADRQGNLLDDMTQFCDRTLAKDSIYAFLHRERERLFPDEAFADLFTEDGRRSVPPSIVAAVMVLQRLEGLSDREAVDRYAFDARRRYASGVGSYDTGGWATFSHTVLVDMRERLRGSERPDRVFEIALDAAKQAGLVGKKRVLDSTPLYDAVATMDTITLIRSAIRNVLKLADGELRAELRAVLTSGDDYASSDKPQIDWDDAPARGRLVDTRAKDAYACLVLLEERARRRRRRGGPPARDGDRTGPRGRRGRHLHNRAKGRKRPGYLGRRPRGPPRPQDLGARLRRVQRSRGDRPGLRDHHRDDRDAGQRRRRERRRNADRRSLERRGAGRRQRRQRQRRRRQRERAVARRAGHGLWRRGLRDRRAPVPPRRRRHRLEVQDPAPGREGRAVREGPVHRRPRDDTVTCPAEITVRIGRLKDGTGVAKFAGHCADCPLATQCTTSALGRKVSVGIHEATLTRVREEQAATDWRADYRATRPKIERKLGHLMRRRHGGRRARVRGKLRVAADFSLLSAAANLARLATLQARSIVGGGWAVA